MRYNEFSEWMENKIKKNSIRDCLSRCKKVEKSLGVDLDEEFQKDEGNTVLVALSSEKYDDNDLKKISEEFGFKEGSNIKFRLSDMKSAVKRYFKFLEGNK